MLQSIWLQIPRVRCDSESEEIGSQDTVEELIQPCSAQLVGNDVPSPWYFGTTYCILMYISFVWKRIGVGLNGCLAFMPPLNGRQQVVASPLFSIQRADSIREFIWNARTPCRNCQGRVSRSSLGLGLKLVASTLRPPGSCSAWAFPWGFIVIISVIVATTTTTTTIIIIMIWFQSSAFPISFHANHTMSCSHSNFNQLDDPEVWVMWPLLILFKHYRTQRKNTELVASGAGL